MADETNTTEQPKQPEKEVTVRHILPGGMLSVYCDQLIIQNTFNEFTLSFFQLIQPVIIKPEDLEKAETVDAQCVARIIVSPNKMGEFVDVINQNWQRFSEKQKLADQDNGNPTNTISGN
jgi:hypothetical protein